MRFLQIILVIVMVQLSCTRNRIEFGTVPDNNYSYLAFIDTVGINISTVVTDSFATGGATSFLLGRYKDPYLGVMKASPFFQLAKPAEVPTIPTGAIYDSLLFIIKLNDYYYGDTSKAQTIYVHELAQTIVTGYAEKLYSNSNVPVYPVPLGSKTVMVRPVTDDSIAIRLRQDKGQELFAKLKQLSTDLTNEESFLNYFKGISLSTSTSDTTAVYGLQPGGMMMRLYYHTNTPFDELHHVNFLLQSNQFAFNQLVADRSGTVIPAAGGFGPREIPASQTNNFSFSQPGTGLGLKFSFPSLKNILLSKYYVKLLKAELVVRPAGLSFDRHKHKLPPRLELAYTDASLINGGAIMDSTGEKTIVANPVIDEIYGINTYYRFNITSYISGLLQQPRNDFGLYVQPVFSPIAPELDRLILTNSGHTDYISRLQLSVLVVNK